MRFHCGECKTRYVIPDEKVRGKALKIRCKNCGNVMTVTDPAKASGPRAAVGAASAAGPAGAGAAGSARRAVASDAALKAGPGGAQVKEKRGASRSGAGRGVAARSPAVGRGADHVERSGLGSSGAGPRSAKEGASSPDAPKAVSDPAGDPLRFGNASAERGPEPAGEPEEWYLADEAGEFGPMTFSALSEKIVGGGYGRDAQVWRDGFEDWMDVADVPELRPVLKRSSSRAVVPVRARRGMAGLPLPTGGRAEKVRTAFSPEPAAADADSVKRPLAAEASSPPDADGAAAGADLPEITLSDPADRVEASRTAEAEAEIRYGLEAQKDLKKMASETARTLKALDQPIEQDAFPRFAAEAVDDLGGPTLPDSPPMGDNIVPAVVPEAKDRGHSLGIVFAILGGVVALTLVVLTVYLILRDRDAGVKPGGPKERKVAQARTHPVPKKSAVEAPDAGTTAPDGGTDGGTDEQEEELVMPAVEISLSRKSGRAGTRKTRPARPDSREAGESGFGPGLYGGVGSSGIQTGRRFMPSPTEGRARGERVSSSGSGRVSQDQILKVVRRNIRRLKMCYERAVRLNPTGLRRVKMRITIRVSSSGQVSSVTIVPGKYRGMSLGSCLVASIRGWRFPSSSRSYGTRFPVSFVGR